MTKLQAYIQHKQCEYGSQFDPAELNPAFFDAFNSGARVTVEFVSNGEVYETKRGTIGVTTGWRPVFLLMLTKRSQGSSYTIGKDDRIAQRKAR